MPPERVSLQADAASSAIHSLPLNGCFSAALDRQSDSSSVNDSYLTISQSRLHRQVAFGSPVEITDSFAERSVSVQSEHAQSGSTFRGAQLVLWMIPLLISRVNGRCISRFCSRFGEYYKRHSSIKHPAFKTIRGNSLLRLVSTFDSTSICYLTIAILMMSVGVVITIVTAKEDSFRISVDAEGNSPQLWIVGPIFVCSGLLIFAKAASRIYQHLLRHSSRSRNLYDDILTSDSRPSLTTVSIPPSYSMALDAPVPHSVLNDGSKPFANPSDDIDPDSDSLRLVTINFDPPPPSYEEAVKYSKLTVFTYCNRSSSATNLPHECCSFRSATADSSQCTTNGNMTRDVRIRRSHSWPTVCKKKQSA
ncbi:hypothetical protein D918_01671 [Trichuris suis]|nr:hypothetical protein D918_01671 [Trichuris suis]